MLHELMQIEKQDCVVAICGAGGKTSLMHMLAREANAENKKTAIMTTTHMDKPIDADVAIWDSADKNVLFDIWDKGKIAAVGQEGIIRGFDPPPAEQYDFICDNADSIYVEADGSKCLPMKYPEVWEPVIPIGTNHVIVVVGMSSLGQPIDEICHRAELVREYLGINYDLMDENAIVKIISAGYKRYNPIILLNQADNDELLKSTAIMKELFAGEGIYKVHALSLHKLNGGEVYKRQD